MPASPTSPFLAERLIARLPPYRRSNLERSLRERAQEADLAVTTGTVDDVPHAVRRFALLGRFAALT